MLLKSCVTYKVWHLHWSDNTIDEYINIFNPELCHQLHYLDIAIQHFDLENKCRTARKDA